MNPKANLTVGWSGGWGWGASWGRNEITVNNNNAFNRNANINLGSHVSNRPARTPTSLAAPLGRTLTVCVDLPFHGTRFIIDTNGARPDRARTPGWPHTAVNRPRDTVRLR
jgi:hypothetical protein